MKIFHDWEFLEQGPVKPVIPISVGMVREDGAELYHVFEEVQEGEAYDAIRTHPWLIANVVPFLPLDLNGAAFGGTGEYAWFALNPKDNAIMPRRMIRNAVREFILSTPSPELWGWYSGYDHVLYSQLFGRMVDLPDGFPMWTNDLKTRTAALGIDDREMPRDPGQQVHHALADAREMAGWSTWLDGIERNLMAELKQEIRAQGYARGFKDVLTDNTETAIIPAVTTDKGEGQ